MSANYRLVRNPNPKKDGKVQPLHARFVPSRTVSTEDLMEEIISKSSFSTGDVKGILQLLQDVIVNQLMLGSNIKFEGIGTFTVSLKCRPVMDKKEIRSESIHFKDVKFRSSKKLRQRLKVMPLFRAIETEKENFSFEDCKKRLLWYLENKKPFITGRDYQWLNHCGKTKATTHLKLFRKEGIISRQGYGSTTFYTKTLEDIIDQCNI